MGEYDWLRSSDFEKDIQQEVERIVSRRGMLDYDKKIISKLVGYVRTYQEPLIEAELIKAAAQRKTKTDALRSINILIEAACDVSKREKHNIVKESDFDEAYESKFCMVWPACGRSR